MKFYVTQRIGPKQTDARRPSVVLRRPDRARRVIPQWAGPNRGRIFGDRVRGNPVSDLHPRSAGGLAPIVAPHSEESSMDFIGRPVERF
jgi:hypothetical protein